MIQITVSDHKGNTKESALGAVNSFDEATRRLAGIDGGARRAIGAAIERTMTSARAYAARSVTKEYALTSTVFKEYTKVTSSNKHRTVKVDHGTTECGILFHGYHIPLIRFDTSFGADGLLTTRVKRGSSAKALEHAVGNKRKAAFTATVNGRLGIYEREGRERFPIDQLFGPATPQMMSANEAVMDDIQDHIRETFEKRLDHEITRILNGWGGRS